VRVTFAALALTNRSTIADASGPKYAPPDATVRTA
jgi:hypothetical protein